MSNQSFLPEDEAPGFFWNNGDLRSLLLFQSPMLQIYHTLAHDIGRGGLEAIRGVQQADGTHVRSAAKLLSGLIATAGFGALGGYQALPMMQTIEAAAGPVVQAIDPKDETLDQRIRQFIAKYIGGIWGQFLTHGAVNTALASVFGKDAPALGDYFQAGSAGNDPIHAASNWLTQIFTGRDDPTKQPPLAIASLAKDLDAFFKGTSLGLMLS